VSDEFYLGVASDGKIKTFVKMEAFYDNASYVGYGERFSHTVTDKAKDCVFCHRNPEVLCEGCEGDILGKGGSFIPQETIKRVLAAPIETHAATPAPTATLTYTSSGNNTNTSTSIANLSRIFLYHLKSVSIHLF